MIPSSRPWECGNPEGISKECGKSRLPSRSTGLRKADDDARPGNQCVLHAGRCVGEVCSHPVDIKHAYLDPLTRPIVNAAAQKGRAAVDCALKARLRRELAVESF